MLKTYARGREAMADALEGGNAADHHEWRKRAKYHYYHARLLKPLWRPMMAARADEAKALADILGNHHDIAVFRDRLADMEEKGTAKATARTMAALGKDHAADLSREAGSLGVRLYAEPPKRLGKRWRRYWKAWKAEQGN